MDNKQKKGISLIVLVITIIVMIILATAIILSLSSNGIIGKANKAKEDTNSSAMKEQLTMAVIDAIDYDTGIVDKNKLVNQLDNSFGTEYTLSEKSSSEWMVKVGDVTYIVDAGGSIREATVVDTLKEIKAGEYATETSKYTDSENNIAVIPKGFTVSSLSDENIIKNGLVIYEGDLSTAGENIVNYQSTNNQYVWIPVNNPSTMYGVMKFNKTDSLMYKICSSTGFKYYGKLYEYNANGELVHLNWFEELKEDEAKEIVLEKFDVSSWEEYLSLYDEYYDTNYDELGTNWDNQSEEEKSQWMSIGINNKSDYVKYFMLGAFKLADNMDDVKYAVYDTNYHDDSLNEYFGEMVESVEKYKGFYIGRYETTGTSSQPKTVMSDAGRVWKKDGYTNNDSIGGVVGQIWDCQFDQALIFLNKQTNIQSKEKNIFNLADNFIELTNSIKSKWNVFSDGSVDVSRYGWKRSRMSSVTGDGVESGRLQLYIK